MFTTNGDNLIEEACRLRGIDIKNRVCYTNTHFEPFGNRLKTISNPKNTSGGYILQVKNMGKISIPSKAKLFSGIMYREENALEMVKKELVRRFGEIDAESRAFAFNFTDYYEQEMGKGLHKKFIVFKELIKREDLAEIKTFTNSIEDETVIDGKRIANIDPGYITKVNLILATTKDFPHRIYLKDGIFAEVTLSFRRNACIVFDWTYPDFRQEKILEFFLGVRNSTVF